MTIETCLVCGGGDLRFTSVLWPRLIAEWQLAPAEIAYLDRQQGLGCAGCGAPLRSMALAEAVARCIGARAPLKPLLADPRIRQLRILGINRVPGVTDLLATLPLHRQLAFPAIDLMDIALPDRSVDLVLHAETLEHVAEPRRALAECLRILAPGGFCCFTVPLVTGRLTRSRAGLPRSYHGAPGIELDDLLVRTEFGADLWTMVLEAGFAGCEMVSIEHPAGLAIKAQRL